LTGTHPDLGVYGDDTMSKWKRLGLAVAAVTALTYGLVLAVETNSAEPATPIAKTNEGNATANQEKEKVEPGKGKRAQEFLEAFNKGDAKAVAGFWTPTGEYTDLEGHKYQGRAAIEKLYAKTFSENKGGKLTITVTSARMITPETAIEEGISEVSSPEGGPPSVAAFTAVLVKKEGEWYFESVHDSVAHPPSNAAHFEDIEFLLGAWAGDDAKGESAHSTYEWAENRNFILSTFATTLNGVPVVGGTQWIGWDAINKQIRSWSFYSGGGFGEGVWSQSEGTWSVKVSAQSADGKKISGTNVIKLIDKDHVSWQITKVTVNGHEMPDPPAVKMARVKPEKEKK
jgi:uncharacterized protein (TIGR02246 family)